MSARTIAASLAVGAAIAGAGYLSHATDSPPAPTCARSTLPGEYRCALPTGGRWAVVYVATYEDGSARAYPVDPDGAR